MVIQKRILLWDYTNSGDGGVPQAMNNVPFGGRSPMASVVNWNAWVPPELKGRAPFHPMVRTIGQLSGTDWATIQNAPFNLILFFNEPERAGVSPEQARDIWYKDMLPLRQHKAKKLGSPAVASDENGRKWFEKWMKLVEKDPPDYVCLHYYSKDADDAIKYITQMHNKYPKHPVMVTEIASIDRKYANVLHFTIKVCNWMDQQHWIHEYGLFDFQRKVADGFVSPAAQLMEPNGHFTQLGNMYLHDQPMAFPSKPNGPGAMAAFEVDEEGGEEIQAPEPPQHGPEDEIHHGTPVDTSNDETADTGSPITADDTETQSNGEFSILSFSTDQQASLNGNSPPFNPDQSNALQVQNNGRRGKNLNPLQWDHNLAANALKWANHLAQIGKLEHSTSAQRPGQGENLAMAFSSGGIKDPLTGAAHMWMNEAKDYHGQPIPQGDFGKYGHYTQCMWRTTTKVGMASARDAKGRVWTVGRYSPPGNWTGQKPY